MFYAAVSSYVIRPAVIYETDFK